MTNLLNNQIKIIVKQRVIYSKELFNYEKYMSLGLHDDRLVRSAVFCKSGKALVAEYFKFQSKLTDESLTDFELKTYGDVAGFLSMMSTHIFKLNEIQ